MRGVPTIPCRVCGVDTLTGICAPHEAERRRARRHSGYDHPYYRAYRRNRAAKPDPCDNCTLRHGAILHHVDGDPGHNVAANYQWLCKPCADDADRDMRARRRRPGRIPRPRGPWQ